VANVAVGPARLVRTFAGHRPLVKQVILSPDGRRALSLDSLTVRLWDVKEQEPVRSFKGHAGTITHMAVSKDWQRLLTGGADGTVRLWDLATGEQLKRLEIPAKESARCVALSDDGRYAASGHGPIPPDRKENAVRLWDLASGKEASVFRGPTGPVHSIAFTPDGKGLVSTDDSSEFRVWSLQSDEGGRRWSIRSSAPANLRNMDVSILADGHTIAFIGRDGSIHTCDRLSPKREYLLEGNFNAKVVFLAKDGKRAVVGTATPGAGGVVRLLELLWGQWPKYRELVRFDTPASPLSVSLSADSRFVLVGGDDGTMRLWDVAKGRP
jgi:WD40 repeat protein